VSVLHGLSNENEKLTILDSLSSPRHLLFSGIMVPQINTAEEARQIVQYSKFPPQGLRGQGSAFPAIAHGLTTPEYMLSANQTILTMIQIETVAGVENVEEIAAVPGVGELLPCSCPCRASLRLTLFSLSLPYVFRVNRHDLYWPK
jgi:citrate lyase beta subunit